MRPVIKRSLIEHNDPRRARCSWARGLEGTTRIGVSLPSRCVPSLLLDITDSHVSNMKENEFAVFLRAIASVPELRHTGGMRIGIHLPSSLTLFLALGLVGCGEPPPPPPAVVKESPPESIWVASSPISDLSLTELSQAEFFDHPWPSDLRLDNGKVRLLNFPNPRWSGNIISYTQLMDGRLDGFSPAAAGFVRFTGPFNAMMLPADDESRLPESPVQLIDIDPNSPEYGQRKLISLQFRSDEGVYYAPNTLAFLPSPGFPLRPHTLYAFVITNALLDKYGQPVERSSDLEEVLGDAPAQRTATEMAKAALEPAVLEIEKTGISRQNIVHLAVFHTNDPTEELFAARDHLRANAPAPTADPAKWHLVATTDYSIEYVGVYGPSPNYQHGKLPFVSPKDGGEFKFVDGVPQIADEFDLRFSLSVPSSDDCLMPQNGYPIALYAHGTGGDYRSYVRDGTAARLAAKCIATMGVDQIFHGKRPGAPPEDDENAAALRFFNVDNVFAARTSNRQSALDEVQRARLFTESSFEVPGKLSLTGEAIRFDPTRVMFFGHSQGGLNGPLFLAADDQAIGGVLSGAGAIMSITLTEKTEPAPSVADLVKSVILGLRPEEFEEMDIFHPALSLAQMLVDTTDPIHYARNIIKEPRTGMKPKSVYMTVGIDSEGVGDSYAPPKGIEMHAVAMGLPLITNSQQRYIPEVYWTGAPGIVDLPAVGVANNIANGAATGGFAQWDPGARDGHFVVFNVSGARSQSAAFMNTLGYISSAKLMPFQ